MPTAPSPAPLDHTAPLHPWDEERLASAVEEARRTDIRTGVADLLGPVLAAEDMRAMLRHCVYDHSALLLFPHGYADALAALRAHGLSAGPVVPSVVVRGRLAQRHGGRLATADVRLTHARPDPAAYPHAPDIEFFLCPAGQAGEAARAAERRGETERHVALRVLRPDAAVVEGVLGILTDRAGFCPDGGGYNPHEGRRFGGTTVRYLARARAGRPERLERLEVKFHGRHPTCRPPEAAWSEDVARVYRAHTTATATAASTAAGDAPVTERAR